MPHFPLFIGTIFSQHFEHFEKLNFYGRTIFRQNFEHIDLKQQWWNPCSEPMTENMSEGTKLIWISGESNVNYKLKFINVNWKKSCFKMFWIDWKFMRPQAGGQRRGSLAMKIDLCPIFRLHCLRTDVFSCTKFGFGSDPLYFWKEFQRLLSFCGILLKIKKNNEHLHKLFSHYLYGFNVHPN